MKLKTRRGTNQYQQKMVVVSGAKYCVHCGILNMPTYTKGAFPRPVYDKCHNCKKDVVIPEQQEL